MTDDRVHYYRKNTTNGLIIQNPLNWYIVSPEWEIVRNQSIVEEITLKHALGINKY